MTLVKERVRQALFIQGPILSDVALLPWDVAVVGRDWAQLRLQQGMVGIYSQGSKVEVGGWKITKRKHLAGFMGEGFRLNRTNGIFAKGRPE